MSEVPDAVMSEINELIEERTRDMVEASRKLDKAPMWAWLPGRALKPRELAAALPREIGNLVVYAPVTFDGKHPPVVIDEDDVLRVRWFLLKTESTYTEVFLHHVMKPKVRPRPSLHGWRKDQRGRVEEFPDVQEAGAYYLPSGWGAPELTAIAGYFQADGMDFPSYREAVVKDGETRTSLFKNDDKLHLTRLNLAAESNHLMSSDYEVLSEVREALDEFGDCLEVEW
jgi:hypothetical protein